MKAKVLLVEDELDFIEIYQEHYELIEASLCFELTFERSAIHALKKIDAGDPFDLVISDYKMPMMNGMEFFTELRKRQIKVPVILTSAHPALIDDDQSTDEGYQVILKPFTFNDLVEEVETILSSIEMGSSRILSFEHRAQHI